jgi:VanZ family protein
MPIDRKRIMERDLRRPLLLQRLCLLLAAAVIFQLFYLGSQPFAAGLVPPPWDKLAHLAVYSAITGLLWIGTGVGAPVPVIAAVIAVGALDEFHQLSVPGRNAGLDDFLVDVCAAVGTGVALLLYARAKKRDS